MGAHSPPITHGSTQSDLGYANVILQQQILEEIKEELNALDAGLVTLYGDLVGSNSDEIRVTRMTGVGWAEAFTTMGSETDPIVATAFTSGTSTITIARHGLAKEESQQSRILAGAGAVTLDMLIEKVPASWLKTLRQKIATTGATISASTGSAAAAWTFDDELDLRTAFHETEGFAGEAHTVRHPEQFSDLAESLRNEPAYQSPEIMNMIQSLKPGGGAFNFLGFQNHATFDVTQSGGGHVGFAYVPGAIGWAVANTSPVQSDKSPIYVPQYGLLIERTSDPKQATARFDANAYFGVALLSATLFPQRKILSIDD